MIPYLNLCRLDAALIAFFSYLVGAELSDGADLWDVILAGAVTAISTNFIYSFNSWADWQIDRIYKPGRPIPSGKILPKHALIYSLALLFLSVAYPFFVFKSYVTLFLFLLLPTLGLVYSAKPLRVRRYPLLSILIICSGLITPIMLGYFMNTQDASLIPLFVILFLYCLSVVPLKQAEEAAEDEKSGYSNLYSRWGEKILIFSSVGLLWVIILALFFNLRYLLKVQMLIFSLSAMICILGFGLFRINLHKLYQTIIYVVIAEGIVFYMILNLK